MYVCERKRIFVVQINFIAQNKAGNIQKSLKIWTVHLERNAKVGYKKELKGWLFLDCGNLRKTACELYNKK